MRRSQRGLPIGHLFKRVPVGASDRDKRQAYRPGPVWVDSSGLWSWRSGPGPSIGILLEWRRSADSRGRPSWEGLVLWAHGRGEVAWSSGVRRMRVESPVRCWSSWRTARWAVLVLPNPEYGMFKVKLCARRTTELLSGIRSAPAIERTRDMQHGKKMATFSPPRPS